MHVLKRCNLVFTVFLMWGCAALSYESILCDLYDNICDSSSSSKSETITPSGSQRVKLNPAAVPTGNIFGLGSIYYKSDFDFLLVKGLGRLGAAISPSNSEETFFGPPAFELPDDYSERKKLRRKYKDSKLNLAAGFDLYDNKKSGLRRFNLSLGLIGKYNNLTSEVLPGAGVNSVFGPFSLGYAVFQDQIYLDYAEFNVDRKANTKLLVENYSGSLFLESLILDYSVMQIKTADITTIRTTTASLLLRRAILSAAIRIENSARSKYDFKKEQLVTEREKSDLFLSAQYKVNKNIMVGVLSNYYLLNELTATATIFF